MDELLVELEALVDDEDDAVDEEGALLVALGSAGGGVASFFPRVRASVPTARTRTSTAARATLMTSARDGPRRGASSGSGSFQNGGVSGSVRSCGFDARVSSSCVISRGNP